MHAGKSRIEIRGDILLLRQMKYFVTIVDCNSFMEAVEQMFISQSAISQQMKVLEAELNVKLFSRKGRSFTLTPAGEYFYQKSKGILEQIEGIRRETIRLGEDSDRDADSPVAFICDNIITGKERTHVIVCRGYYYNNGNPYYSVWNPWYSKFERIYTSDNTYITSAGSVKYLWSATMYNWR